MANEINEWDETHETRRRAANEAPEAAREVDLWRGLLAEDETPVESEARVPLEEHEYAQEVREQAATIEDVRARGQLLVLVDGLYADRSRPTEAERERFRSELARVTDLGGGNLARGLLRELSREVGEPIDGAETAWPEPVATALSELDDRRARTQLQHRTTRVCPDPERATPQQVAVLERLVATYRRGGDMQGDLVREWLRHNPERRPHGDKAAELPAWRERCEALRDRFAEGSPGVTGSERLVERVDQQMKGPLYEMEIGRSESTAETLGGLASNLRGIAGEWEAAVERSALGPVEVGRHFAYTNRESGRRLEVDVDLIEDGGRVWREEKNIAAFGIGSDRWPALQWQLTRLRWAAEDNPIEGGVTPRICVDFRRDARRSVVVELAKMGVEVVVKGRLIDDMHNERGLEL